MANKETKLEDMHGSSIHVFLETVKAYGGPQGHIPKQRKRLRITFRATIGKLTLRTPETHS